MDNKLIITLLLIIIAMLIVLGIMIVNPLNAKTDTTINVTSNNTLYDGDYFSISLSDINGTPIANQTVNITIIDANGGKNPQNVTTNEMGNGMLQLNGLTVGNYTINVTYGGNENYSACNITQKIEIKEKQVSTSTVPYNTKPVYDGRTLCYKNGIRGVYSPSGEFFPDEGQFYQWTLKITHPNGGQSLRQLELAYKSYPF